MVNPDENHTQEAFSLEKEALRELNNVVIKLNEYCDALEKEVTDLKKRVEKLENIKK